MILAALALLSGIALPDVLQPADPSTFRTEGVAIRLLAEPDGAEGGVRGVLVFDLEPGWKTYWQDPGGVGLAPSFDFGPGEAPEMLFPLPKALREGDAPFIGYDEPVAIAFRAPANDAGEPLRVSLTAGICRDICIPVAAELSVDPDPDAAADAADAASLARAFLALPVVGAQSLAGRIDGDRLTVERPAEIPAGAELFVSGPGGWSFGASGNDPAGWRIPVLSRPSGKSGPIGVFEGVYADGATGRRVPIEIETD